MVKVCFLGLFSCCMHACSLSTMDAMETQSTSSRRAPTPTETRENQLRRRRERERAHRASETAEQKEERRRKRRMRDRATYAANAANAARRTTPTTEEREARLEVTLHRQTLWTIAELHTDISNSVPFNPTWVDFMHNWLHWTCQDVLPVQRDSLVSSFTHSPLSVCVVVATRTYLNCTPPPTIWILDPYHHNCRFVYASSSVFV